MLKSIVKGGFPVSDSVLSPKSWMDRQEQENNRKRRRIELKVFWIEFDLLLRKNQHLDHLHRHILI